MNTGGENKKLSQTRGENSWDWCGEKIKIKSPWLLSPGAGGWQMG